MSTSIDYQDRATALQNDINSHLILIRQTVAEVLQANMNETIHQTKGNSDRVLSIYGVMQEKMNMLVHDDCYEDLTDLADGIVKMVGFKIGNVLTEHDKNVTIALGDAEETIKKFDLISTSVQRVVHRAFIKSNIFKEPEKVSEKFIEQFESYKAEWEIIRPEISEIVRILRNNFNRMLINLGGNFGAMQKSFDVSFNMFESDAVTICVDYARSARARTFSGTLSAGKFK